MRYFQLAGIAILIATLSVFFRPVAGDTPSTNTIALFRKKLLRLVTYLQDLKTASDKKLNVEILQSFFIRSRAGYKQVEFLIEYYYPSKIRTINGPPLPFADAENSLSVLEPAGFQTIESSLFTKISPINYPLLSNQVGQLINSINVIYFQKDPYYFYDRFILDAMRFEIYRISALGISGFDSQEALNALPESSAALQSLDEFISLFSGKPGIQSLLLSMNKRLRAAAMYLSRHNNFDQFDRLFFITNFLNPVSRDLLKLQQQLHLELPSERRIISTSAPDLFSMKFYDPSGYSPNKESDASPGKIDLGRQLFYDNILSENGQRSCADCHQPSKAFTDGLPKSLSVDNKTFVSRNAPTLINSVFQPVLFYDSRAVFAEHQVVEVLHNKREMGGSMTGVVERVTANKHYRELFEQVYATISGPVNEDNIANAIASYLRSIIAFNSRFDQYMQGNRKALNQTEQNGFNLFMGKAKCATCHFVPLFNGVAPPYFSEAESEVIGVPLSTDTISPLLDSDPGKFDFYPVSIFKYAFKTPTLRNIALTSPYMHNGIYKSLSEVINFYNIGGGSGLGIAPPDQTLPSKPLQLSDSEKKQLELFLNTLTDTALTKIKIGK